MTVQTLSEALGLTVFHLADGQAEVTDGYIGDLLSWVMGRAPDGCVWMTIMSNANVAAVASLSGAACVLLTEGVTPDPDLLERAKSHSINLLGCQDGSYQAALRVAAALGTAP